MEARVSVQQCSIKGLSLNATFQGRVLGEVK